MDHHREAHNDRIRHGEEAVIFLATEFDDERTLARRVEATDWPEAERICEERGWRLDGEFMGEVWVDTFTDAAVAAGQMVGGLS